MSDSSSFGKFDEPDVSRPFQVLETDEFSTVVDSEGRQFMFDYRNKEFVRELANVLNENGKRLEDAWKRGIDVKGK